MNNIDKWTKVQEHPVLECGVMTKEDRQVKVTALFKSNDSTIMVYNKEDSYVFMRTEGRMNWHPIHSVPIEIIQQLC
ncbi:hypothetical protein DXB21_13750 [Bacteroides faecis]|uniref:hypothetical protein n=1 Tax=Bacteroides faecis TaxID=674529 RepID=UPI000E432C5C|nr:hypothetical protein [Bacteroides faecis]MCS2481046.1 hypothetical protein [Bacteroides faecis]RGO31258.1 hypothetical protein DXB21_13750 [Bacteroides faecis]